MRGPERRREEGRDRLPDDRRRRRPALHRQPGLHRVPPAARTLQRHHASGLPVLRPRPVRALHVRGRAHGRTAHQGAARPVGADVVPQDERCHRPPDLRPDPARHLHARHRARVRRRGGPDDQAGRPRPGDDGVEDRRPHREDLHRPQHEPVGRQHLGRVLGATRAAGARLDAAHVGRGLRGRVRAAGLPDRQRVGSLRAPRRSVRRRAHGGDGSDACPRGARRGGRGRAGTGDGCAAPPHGGALHTGEDLRGGGGGLEGSRPVRVRAAPRLRTRGHHRTRAGRRRRRDRQLVRDPQASGDAPALRRATGEGRCASELGGAQRPAHGEGRQAPRGAHRGPPAGIRIVRGHDPRGPLRRGRGPHLRRRLVRAGGVDRLEGELHPARPPLPRPGVPLREDPHGLARVPGERPIGAADPRARAAPADAGRGRMGGVRRRRVVVRAQARRHPVPRRPRHGRDHPADPPRPRRHGAVPRAAHGARARRPGERRDRRRDRGLRRARQEFVRGACSSG